MRVDAHQHFWRYSEEEFGWIDASMKAIRRDFLPCDLKPWLERSGVNATIAVQARQSIEETTWLLDLAGQNDWIWGVVGWVPLASSDIEQTLETLSDDRRLKGVRHVLQAEDASYFARPDFHAGVALLRKYALIDDILVVERQLPAAIAFVDRHPGQVFILDHLAKPRIASQALQPWRTQVHELARRPHIACKVSGMVTEARFDRWTAEDLRPYLDTVLEAFGPSRLLFGSDWPVCTVASEYDRWVRLVEEWAAPLTAEERASIFGGNAIQLYRLREEDRSTPGPMREVQFS